MLRQDFIDDVNTWSGLIHFCYDWDSDICSNIYSEEAKNEDIDENLVEWASEHTWYELLDILEGIPTGYEYYYKDDWGDWYEADDDLFIEYKEDVLRWMDENEYWENEGDDEFDDVEIFDEEDLEPIEPEDISFTELLTSCSDKLKKIEETKEQEAREDNEYFDSFVMNFVATTNNNQ